MGDKAKGCGKSQNGGVLGFIKVKGHRNNRRTCCPNIVSTYTQGSWKRLAAIQSTGVLNTVRTHTSGGDGSGGCNKIAENQYAEGATIKDHVGGVVQPKNSKCPEQSNYLRGDYCVLVTHNIAWHGSRYDSISCGIGLGILVSL